MHFSKQLHQTAKPSGQPIKVSHLLKMELIRQKQVFLLMEVSVPSKCKVLTPWFVNKIVKLISHVFIITVYSVFPNAKKPNLGDTT